MAESNAQSDLGAHESTYSSFLALMKWGTVASAIIALIVVILIAS
jgi:hypothetical protein